MGIFLEKRVVEATQLIEFKEALTKLVANPELFKKVAEAFEKDDSETFRDVLGELGILRFCWLICRWFCVKMRGYTCVFLCPEPEKRQEPTIDEMLEFGRLVLRLMEKEEVFKALFEAYRLRDVAKFQSILREYQAIRFCHQLCRWFSNYYCTVKCRIFCPPMAKIVSPSALSCVQPKVNKVDDGMVTGVEIRGIASGGAPFSNYRLEYSADGGASWRQDAPGSGDIIIVYPDGHRGGVHTTPIGPPPGTLGYLDTTNLSAQTYSLRLTVTAAGVVVTDVAQFQLHQKAIVIDGVGRIPVILVEPPPAPPEPPRKLILAGLERAVGGYATIGGSAYVEGCGKRYKRYKLLRANGWVAPPGPGTAYDDVEAPGSVWQRILEVDYTGMPVFVCFHDNSPVGDLTRRWVKRKCWLTFPPTDFVRLEWSPWTTSGSGKVTLLLAVQDDAVPPNTYFDSLEIWLDNIAMKATLDSIGIPGATVDKCKPLSIKKIMDAGGILEIRGTAWDDEIESGNLTQPSLNFDHFTVGWKKNCDPSYPTDGIELMPATNPGKERIMSDILAAWDIREKDPTTGTPTGKPRPDIEPCAYIVQLQVWDNSRINDDGGHWVHKELAFTLEA